MRPTGNQPGLAESEGQLKGLHESIQFTSLQIREDEVKLADLEGKLEELKNNAKPAPDF